MKYIIFLFFMILSFSSQAKWGPDSTCSMRGTTVIYTNGIDTKEDDAFIAMANVIDGDTSEFKIKEERLKRFKK